MKRLGAVEMTAEALCSGLRASRPQDHLSATVIFIMMPPKHILLLTTLPPLIGTVEGRLGSIRFFFVSPEFQRMNVGKRLLYRVEKAMLEEGCVRIMFSIPSTRSTLETWLHYQDFEQVASVAYPAAHLKHDLVVSDVSLNLFQKPLGKKVSNSTNVSMNSSSSRTEDSSHESIPPSMPAEMQRNTHLPPHWRGIQTAAERDAESKNSATAFSMARVSDSVGVDIPEVD